MILASGVNARISLDRLGPLSLGRFRPAPPIGFIFITDADGAYLTDADGAYILEAI